MEFGVLLWATIDIGEIDIFTSEEGYGKYATRVPDVVSYEFYEWCTFL